MNKLGRTWTSHVQVNKLIMEKNIFHILNRGVEKRKIFLNKKDYLRFVHNLYDFNDTKNVISYFDRRQANLDVARPRRRPRRTEKEELVDVLCWTLISNHPHILVQEKTDKGASRFSQKLFDGYTKYFNSINERNGVLFQGRSKIILIKHNVHFLYLPFYILANPLNLFQLDWREKGIKNPKKAFEFLENYQWSAFQDLMGQENFPEVINKNLFFELFDTNEKQFKKDFIEWLENYDRDFDFGEWE